MTNVAELTGAALDYWTDKALPAARCVAPSSSWVEAGPIIERERIEISPSVTPGDTRWSAWAYGRGVIYFGPTPLVAAMRAFVASRFGPTVPPPVLTVERVPATDRRRVARCEAYQASDQMLCKCGRAWDVNDPEPPECGKATAKDRR